MSGAAQIIIKQNEYLRKFRRAGAVDARAARSLDELGIKPGHVFGAMERKAVFLPGRAPGTYYMDQAAAEEFIAARRRRANYLLLLAVVAFLVLLFLVRR